MLELLLRVDQFVVPHDVVQRRQLHQQQVVLQVIQLEIRQDHVQVQVADHQEEDQLLKILLSQFNLKAVEDVLNDLEDMMLRRELLPHGLNPLEIHLSKLEILQALVEIPLQALVETLQAQVEILVDLLGILGLLVAGEVFKEAFQSLLLLNNLKGLEPRQIQIIARLVSLDKIPWPAIIQVKKVTTIGT